MYLLWQHLVYQSEPEAESRYKETDVLAYCHRDGRSYPAIDFEVDLYHKYVCESQYCIEEEIFYVTPLL